MRISTQTKNAIRMLVHCARRRGQPCRVPEIAKACGMTEFSAFKLAPVLVRAGFLKSIRGRGGGVCFELDPKEVSLGAVIRATDPSFATTEESSGAGTFESMVDDAIVAFTEVMDGHSVADLMGGGDPVSTVAGTDSDAADEGDDTGAAACRPDDP